MSPLYFAVIELFPSGKVELFAIAPPVSRHVFGSTTVCTGPVAICVAPEKNVTVPVAGFPQLVPPTVAESAADVPKRFMVGNGGMVTVVGGGVIVKVVEAAGPAVKLESPL